MQIPYPLSKILPPDNPIEAFLCITDPVQSCAPKDLRQDIEAQLYLGPHAFPFSQRKIKSAVK